MAAIVKQEFTIIPAETIVDAEVTSVEEKETPFWVDDKDHSKGKSRQYSFRFLVTSGEFQGLTVFGNTGLFYSDNSKLGSWIREILAIDELPDEMNTDALEGLPVRLVIGNRSKEINGVMTVSGHFAETVSRVEDDDYLTADDAF